MKVSDICRKINILSDVNGRKCHASPAVPKYNGKLTQLVSNILNHQKSYF